MFVQRRISPGKLRAAREAAGYGVIADMLAELRSRHSTIIGRSTYWRWEDTTKPGLTLFDWNYFEMVCDVLGVKPEDISDPIEDEK